MVWEEHSWGTNGTELPAGPTQLRLACQHTPGRGCFWGSVPAMGQVCGCSVDLSLQSPDTMLGGQGQAALGLAPGPTMPQLPLQIRVEGRGPGEEAGGGPYLLFTIRMCAAATRPAGAALCASLPRNVCRQVGSGHGASF